MLSKWGLCLATIFIGMTLAVISILPPRPQGPEASPEQFSAGRAMEDIRIIAAKPHPTGSEENAKVRAYLMIRLQELGLEARETQALLPERPLARLNRWSGEDATEQSFTNVIGIRRGTDSSKPALLLMAHHDTVWGSPGASDDTIGIASIFEIIRAVNTGPPIERDLVVLFTDAEEIGLVGARHFFENNPLRDDIGAIINFEARGGGGTANMFQTSAMNGNAARLYARVVREPSASSLSIFVYNILPNDTDLTTALGRGYVAYNIANLGRAEYYHSPKITADALEVETLQHMGSQGLDLTRALLTAEALPTPRADATFFDLFGLFTIVYAPAWGWLFIGIAGICLAGAYKRTADPEDVLFGALRMLGFIVLGGAVLFGLNYISGAGKGADYYDRLAAIPKIEFMTALVGAALFIGFFGQKFLSRNARIGAALPLFLVAFAGQGAAPTATYFISIGVMIYAVSIFLMRGAVPSKLAGWSAAILCALVFGYMAGLYHLLMIGVGPDLPSVAVLPFSLMALAILPVFPGFSTRFGRSLIGVLCLLALAAALWIRLDPLASTVPLY